MQQMDLGRHLPHEVTNFCQLEVNILVYLLRMVAKHAWELCTLLCLLTHSMLGTYTFFKPVPPLFPCDGENEPALSSL